MRRRRTVAAALLTVGAVAAMHSPAQAQTPQRSDQPGITVFGNDSSVLVVFDSAKCTVAKKHGKMQFKALAKSHGWKLDLRLNDFKGYDADYPIVYGIGTNNFIVTSPGDVRYTNIYEPDFPINPVGGAAAFPGGKKKVFGLGFIAAFSATGAADGSDGIALGGRATCKYPKKK